MRIGTGQRADNAGDDVPETYIGWREVEFENLGNTAKASAPIRVYGNYLRVQWRNTHTTLPTNDNSTCLVRGVL